MNAMMRDREPKFKGGKIRVKRLTHLKVNTNRIGHIPRAFKANGTTVLQGEGRGPERVGHSNQQTTSKQRFEAWNNIRLEEIKYPPTKREVPLEPGQDRVKRMTFLGWF